MNSNHTFAICAYKESPYLEDCIQSLLNQTIKTNIIIVTSTPNAFIENLSQKYSIPLFINQGEKGITQDWNFAYKQCNTKFITIAHQDDFYVQTYVEIFMKKIENSKHPLIAFSDYYELRNNTVTKTNKLLKIKRLLLAPLKLSFLRSSIFIRRRILSMGSPICCPSVMFAKDNLPTEIFQHGFRADEDWEAWERISKYKGDFIYITQPLTYHRIHSESETSKILEDNARTVEDFIMFQKFWPKPIAKVIAKIYGTSEQSNNLK